MAVVDLKDAKQLFQIQGSKLREAAIRGLRSAAARGVQQIVVGIIPSRSPQPVDRGVYRAGWRAENLPDGAQIVNTEPHAAFIEYGVRAANVKPGTAMIQALAEWVVRKGLAQSASAVSVAWAIAKTMRQRGIFNRGQGLGILKELEDKWIRGFIQEEVAREIAAIGG